jgi:hypothetical protein
MSEDLIMLLIRIGIIVFPASFACFILGFLWGRSTASKALKSTYEPMEWQEPEVEAQTIVTTRNRRTIL